MKLNEDKKAIQKSKQILKLINNANRPTILIVQVLKEMLH